MVIEASQVLLFPEFFAKPEFSETTKSLLQEKLLGD